MPERKHLFCWDVFGNTKANNHCKCKLWEGHLLKENYRNKIKFLKEDVFPNLILFIFHTFVIISVSNIEDKRYIYFELFSILPLPQSLFFPPLTSNLIFVENEI